MTLNPDNANKLVTSFFHGLHRFLGEQFSYGSDMYDLDEDEKISFILAKINNFLSIPSYKEKILKTQDSNGNLMDKLEYATAEVMIASYNKGELADSIMEALASNNFHTFMKEWCIISSVDNQLSDCVYGILTGTSKTNNNQEEEDTMNEENTQENTQVTSEPDITTKIDSNMRSAINTLLSQASGGAIQDIELLIKEKFALENTVQETKQELTKALMKAKTVPIPTTGTTTTHIGELTYEIVEVPAKDLFLIGGKKPSKHFEMLVPTLIWKDSTGTVVQHPETPAIDDNYMFNVTNTLVYLTSLIRNNNSWLFGHTGTGKSTFVEQIAARMGWPVTRINLDSSMERADLVGQITLTEQNGTTISKYEEGILPRAMQRPGILLMDEIDAGRPDILFVIQRALESKGLMLTEDAGRVITPHPMFRFTATANTRGQGDEYGVYSGTRTMNSAMVDRFTAFIEFDYMQPKEESVLLQKLTPSLPTDLSDKMCQFAREVRTAFGKGEVYSTISPRGLSVFADSYMTFVGNGIPNDTAFSFAINLSVLNKVTSDNRQKFLELASRVFGFSIK